MGCFPVLWPTNMRLLYVVTVRWNFPRLNVVSAPSTENFVDLVQNLTISLSCQLKPSPTQSSGTVTSRMNAFSGLPNCCLLLFISISMSESTCFEDIPRRWFWACSLFRGKSLSYFAFTMPPFSTSTLWKVCFGFLVAETSLTSSTNYASLSSHVPGSIRFLTIPVWLYFNFIFCSVEDVLD